MAGEALITGTGETAYRRRRDATTTTHQLLAAAARLALTDAGLEPADVDGLGVASFTLAPDRSIDLAYRLGLRVGWLMDGGTGGSSALDMLQHARRAVEAGDATAVVLVAGDLFEGGEFRDLVEGYNTATRDHLAPIPTGGPNALFALLTSRHQERHGLSRERYGDVVLAQRSWAACNPSAAFRDALTLDEYLSAPIVAAPLTILDCVPVVSGAAAVVVTSRPPRAGAARIRALAARHNPDGQDGDGLATGLRYVRERLWEEAGAEPADIDVASVYDDYPVMVLVQLEDLGFADAPGEVSDLARRIGTRELRVNTGGGQLSVGQAGAAGGMLGLVETVRQVSGTAGDRQLEGVRLGLVTGYGMVAYRYGACATAAVLERT